MFSQNMRAASRGSGWSRSPVIFARCRPLGPTGLTRGLPVSACCCSRGNPSLASFTVTKRSLSTAGATTQASAAVVGAPRGTHDLEGAELAAHRFIIDTARNVSARHAFEEIETPTFESTQVFQRSLGGDSDVVMKEMYTFNDKGNNSLTLRPEGTAGVVRAFVNKKDFGDLPRRYFYSGAMYRYERPQKGRLRQFHQVGVENLGSSTPTCVVEVIQAASSFLDALRLNGSFTLELNSLGDTESRERYRGALREYLTSQKMFLSADSVSRLERGSELRVLDSKDASDQQVVRSADCPTLTTYLSPSSRDHFDQVCELLKELGLSFSVNPRLVRGLDYYAHTVFEFVGRPSPQLGPQQATLLAGGVYDNLIATFGGPAIPGVGWAAGVERLALVLDRSIVPPSPRPVFVLLVSDSDSTTTSDADRRTSAALTGYAMRVSDLIRRSGHTVVQKVDGSEGGAKLRKWMKKALKANACATVFVGDAEYASSTATLKLLDSGQQLAVPLDDLDKELRKLHPQ